MKSSAAWPPTMFWYSLCTPVLGVVRVAGGAAVGVAALGCEESVSVPVYGSPANAVPQAKVGAQKRSGRVGFMVHLRGNTVG